MVKLLSNVFQTNFLNIHNHPCTFFVFELGFDVPLHLPLLLLTLYLVMNVLEACVCDLL